MIFARLNEYLIIVVSIVLFIMACSSNPFKESCIKTLIILQNAQELIEISSAESAVKGEKTEGVIIKHDIRKSKKYLKSKGKQLNKHYQLIKSYLGNSNERNNDALYILALINEMTYFFSGEAIEDRCKYIRIIRKERNMKLSGWIIDEVFGPIMNNNETLKSWRRMGVDKKCEEIYGFLMVPDKTGEKCGLRAVD